MKEIALISKRLAVSDSGFIFDPVLGKSFTVNETGLAVLRLLQQQLEPTAITEHLSEQFTASNSEIKRDISDFTQRLQGLLK